MRKESLILGALSRLDDFFLNTQSRSHSGHLPEPPWNSSTEILGTNEIRSKNDPHPEVGVSFSQSSQEFNPEETFYSYEKLVAFLLRCRRNYRCSVCQKC